MSTTAVRVDPYRAFNFLITLVNSPKQMNFGGYAPPVLASPPRPPKPLGASLQTSAPAKRVAPAPPPAGGFSECTGLEMGMDIEEYKEGGNNATVLRFPTRMKWTNLRLKRGVALSDNLWLWLYGFAQGSVSRKNGVITLLDEQQNPVKSWSFKRGLPVRWTGPSLNAGQSQVAIEELEIAHEGLTLL